MASIPPKRSRESDEEDDAHDQLVDPARQSSTCSPLPTLSYLLLTPLSSLSRPNLCISCIPTVIVAGEVPKRKRGRPPGSGKKKDAPVFGEGGEGVVTGQEGQPTDATTATGEPAPAPVKRGRGRPKKVCCVTLHHAPLFLIYLLDPSVACPALNNY